MKVIRILAGGALALLATAALAQAPFQFNGLHPDLTFAEAVARIEQLGGQCRVKQSRTEGGDVSAQCGMSSTGEPAPAGNEAPPAGPEIALQPITRIGVEAPVESAQLTRIVFVFEGSLDAVAAHLVRQYGPPDHGETGPEESWSRAQRRGWSQGNYTMGLLSAPDLVILTAHRAPPDRGTD